MTAMTTQARSFLPYGRPLTRADLETMPDDGHRYELIDGVLIVTPAPRVRHQEVSGNLFVLLRTTCPTDLKVLYAPVDVVLADDTVIQPDLLVARRETFTERDLPTAPLLAVEILSPSTRGVDLLLKKERLQRSGCRHYWIIDPDKPSVTAWTLVDGAYHEEARAAGTELFQVTEPFPVSFTPSALLD